MCVQRERERERDAGGGGGTHARTHIHTHTHAQTHTKMLEAEEVARGYAASLINEHVYDTLNK
jgi:hypothetical protein